MVFIISLEGNIGSGKSTLLRALKTYTPVALGKDFNIKYVQEPIEEWNSIIDEDGETILQKFYGDQASYAFSFQIMAYITRLRKMLRIIEESDDNTIIICERSLETDRNVFGKMLYDRGKIRDIDWNIYNYWFDTFAEKITPNLLLYIETSIQTCSDRITKRQRDGEGGIALEYLQRCELYHTNWITNSGTDFKIINGDPDNSDKRSYESLIVTVMNIIRGCVTPTPEHNIQPPLLNNVI